MRIAQISPLVERVPPKLYGGIERIVSYLTEELVAQGHEVTLFASGDSVTKARLIAPRPQALRLDPTCKDHLPHHLHLLEHVMKHADEFDMLHFHLLDNIHFPLARRLAQKHVTTLHWRLDFPDFQPLFREYGELPFVGISSSQRRPMPWVNWQGTVYHGLPKDLYSFNGKGGDYLAFLGRISPEKRVDRAIEIARRSGMELKIAAKVNHWEQEYFDQRIKPLIEQSSSLVEFVGEINDKEKNEFLGNAAALLFPVDWPEPFGLVMIEALACGTPVIAYLNGSVPEVVEDGSTGFIVQSIRGAVQGVDRLGTVDRRRCRESFEQRFAADRMTRDYLAIYDRLLDDGKTTDVPPRP
jgi:glycosyltransferase involved in cell wall biosynthesis